MNRWIIVAVVVYLLVVFVALSLCRVAGLADDAMFDWEPDEPSRPCPLCGASDVYVDVDDVCFCPCCLASYPLSNVTEAP
jgi:hypothetical protein